MSVYKSLLRPILFQMDAETVHRLAKPVLRQPTFCKWLGGGPVRHPGLEVRIGSLVLPNPVGVAPGFDKDCELTAGLSQLGFGYLVPGTVMPVPRPGNPRPRITRLPDQSAMQNCMGLPSRGVDYCAAQLYGHPSRVPVIASIGALDLEGYLRCFERMEPVSDAIEVNPRCNNNREDAGTFLNVDNFERVIATLARRKRKPLFLKINNYETEAERQERLDVVERGLFYGVDGFSTLATWKAKNDRLSVGEGTISGRPLLERTLRAVRDIRTVTRGKAVIRARGGIFSGEDAFRVMAAGAHTVDLLTAFVYEGWGIARRINTELLAKMAAEGVPSVAALVGTEGSTSAAD